MHKFATSEASPNLDNKIFFVIWLTFFEFFAFLAILEFINPGDTVLHLILNLATNLAKTCVREISPALLTA